MPELGDFGGQLTRAAAKQRRWAEVNAVPAFSENSDTEAECLAKWAKIYTLFAASGESAQDEVFAAVNMYFLKNGASPRGKYAKPIRTAGGQEVAAGEVVKITGRLPGELRQFLRGRLEDSYYFLSTNPAIIADDSLAAIAENAGVPRTYCWLLADWLGTDCQYFVGNQADIYRALSAQKIALANVKRAQTPDAENRLIEAAPESKVVGNHGRKYNEDLF